MHVSIWVMILWLLGCYGALKAIFSPPKTLKLGDKILAEDEAVVKIGAIIMVFVVWLLMMVLNTWYFVSSSIIIANVFFTLFSAIHIIWAFYSLGRMIRFVQKALKEGEATAENKTNIMLWLRLIHLAYFAYFIFTGVSLLDLIE